MTMLFDITVIRRCELCDVPLEYALGDRRLDFTGHSPELCRVGTLDRIRTLQDSLAAKDELHQIQAAEFARRVDEILAKHGLPTLHELATSDAARGVGIGPGLGEMLRVRGTDPRSLVDQKPGSCR
jgi:hypothetical protein